MEKRIAVIFPGVGYHVDKPLLYYGRKLAGKYGYEIVCADYGTLPSGIKGDEKKMYDAYEQALANVTAGLSEVDFSSYDRVLFISKSIGTAVAASYDAGNQIGAGHVFYTPVAASFQAIGREGIVFHGTGDDWAETDVIAAECEKRGLPLYLTEQANHSMETGGVFRDLEILETIMKETDKYIKEFSGSCKLEKRFEFRYIHPEEGDQAARIEQICFPPNEACTEKMMKDRAAAAPELFLVAVDREKGRLAGFFCGLATDEERFRDEFFYDNTLYQPEGKNVILLGLDVLPEYRGQGVAKELMGRYLQKERERGRKKAILTCLEDKIPMYEKMGFTGQGLSRSAWGGIPWYEMSCQLNS